jgi:hypothetical protein
MGRPRSSARAGLAATAAALLVAGCGGQPAAIPTIGSPSPITTQASTDADRSAELAQEWDLTGVPLPADWPDMPLPRGTEVVTAYAIGAEPRRTWTATFTADGGTALDIAGPVVEALRERGYVPIAEYVGAAATNTGLYSFAAPTFAVYVVLGEDDGRPNVVITVRGSADESAGLPVATDPSVPRNTATAVPSPSGLTGTPTPQPSVPAPGSASPQEPSGGEPTGTGE